MAQQSFAAISLLRHTRRGTHLTFARVSLGTSNAKHPHGWLHGNVVTDSPGNVVNFCSSWLQSYNLKLGRRHRAGQ